MLQLYNMIKTNNLLRIFLGLVFLSAGIYRIFNWQQAVLEISNLHVPFTAFLAILVITLEIAGGVLLILNFQTKKVALAFSIFIALALILAFLSNGQEIINNIGKLFTFQAEPTDFFLHFTYLIILLFIASK